MESSVSVMSGELSRLLSTLGSDEVFTLNHILNQSEEVRGSFMNYIYSIVSPDQKKLSSEAVMALLAKLGFCDHSAVVEILKKSDVDYDLLTFWIGLLNNLKNVQLSMRLSPSETTSDADGIDHLKMLLNNRIDFRCLLSNSVPEEVDLDGKQNKANDDSSEGLAGEKTAAHNVENMKNISEELSTILIKLSNKVCVEDGFQEPLQGCEQLGEYCGALQFPTNLRQLVECPTEEVLSISQHVQCDTTDEAICEITALLHDLKNS